jgi:hypothetical protein
MAKGKEGETGDSFTSLDEATADATRQGFDPFSQYWTARVDGHTTHYRPGKSILNLPAGEDPKD